jgi:signal peptidase I
MNQDKDNSVLETPPITPAKNKLRKIEVKDEAQFKWGVALIYFGIGASILPLVGRQFFVLPIGQLGFIFGPIIMVAGAVMAVRSAKDPRDVARHLWQEWLRPIGEAVIIAVVITTFVFTTVAISGNSDLPSIRDGERVFVPKYEMWLSRLGVMSYKRGDLVVLKPPKDAGRVQPIPGLGDIFPNLTYKPFYIKRIVGVPGDKIMLERGILTVNGIRINETHTVPYWKKQQSFDDCSYLANSDFWNFHKSAEANQLRPESPCAEGKPNSAYKVTPFVLKGNQYFVMGDNRSPGGSEDGRAFGPVTLNELAGRATFVWWPLFRRDDTTKQLVFNMRQLPRPEAFEKLNKGLPQPK